MKKVRSRITISVFLLVAVTSIVSLVLSSLIRNGVIFVRDRMTYVWFGYAFRDILLLLFVSFGMIVSVFSFSRTTTNPILKVTEAMKEIAAGNFDVHVSLRENVEEFEELQNGFNLMAADLKNNAYLRRDFISNVSHELKTPLAVINGYAKLIEEGNLTSEEQTEYAEYISRESDRLMKLTANMLRLSRIDGAGIKPSCDVFSLDEQIRGAILILEPQWSKKDIDVNVNLEEIRMNGDKDLLSQVWLNLIENAVKYTSVGGHIEITANSDTDGIIVSVADNGTGMSEEVMSHMFEIFYQGDTSHKKEGSGLGLSIVKRIVELHGGNVTAASAPGTGSVFTVVLPYITAAPPECD